MTTFYEFQLISVPTFWTHIFFKVLFLNLRETVGRITGEKEKWREFRNQRQKNAEGQKSDSFDIKYIYYPLFSSPIQIPWLPPHG